jgi:predicted alpha/beta hydrolase family esterase
LRKAIIIHGTKGSRDGNWFPWLAKELGKRGVTTTVPQFPTPEGQNLENWFATFQKEVGELDASSIIIGHSIGAVFALRLLERLKRPINTAVIVSGFTGELGLPEYDALNASFVQGPFNWQRIHENAAKILCINGSNDPYIPPAQGQEIADGLKVENILVQNGGHLNAEFGYTSFPQLIAELQKAETL